MTVFEYLSVAVSIVLSLAVVRLLSGLPHLAVAPKRYWVHFGYVFLVALQIALVWWNMWAYHQVTDWIFPGFISILIVPSTVYFIASTLVPDAPESIESWRTYFFRIRRRFFIAYIFLFLCFFTNSWLLLELPVVHPQRILQASGIALCSVGASSSNSRVQAVLVSTALVLVAIAVTFFFFRPGGIAGSR